jgi:hypothetical protein
VKRIHNVVLLAGAAECVIAVEAAGSERMQVSEHLERGALPGVSLTGHGRSHGHARGDRATERGVIQTRAHDIERDVRSLKGSRVAGSDEG